ncbi:MAG: Asp-tRNA(Asn)/Glu-tRNA(Gln) amidotransferase subunit GatB [Candidatus Eremiobacteraeota bacterium]|nr:Asp-tRNA(Asn)/Glu-tRNA(Gln) amidotransferase subunit GatB [Candidatus Eremiobacteraeota bacterium]
MAYETVIGLEVHVELNTKTKLFCGCENRFAAEPNSLACPVCLGLPGLLPVVNKRAVEKHIMAAIALGCEILEYSKFDRKNYYYPDMPKNYQISQYDLPIAIKGCLEIEKSDGTKKVIGITRIHLEEDTGKSIHGGGSGSIMESDYTLLDYNRAGVPLMEIVSEPDMRSPEEAYLYLTGLKKILNWIGVSDCKMEQGSLRCDANISLRKKGELEFGVKTEIKNMNSFKSVRSALEFEEKRQAEVLENGGKISQETRGWEEDKGITVSMRSKEDAHDYRYFPEPDLAPLKISREWVDEIGKDLPELPDDRRERFIREYRLPEYDAGVLTTSREMSDFLEEAVVVCNDPKQVSNWLMSDISKYLNEKQVEIQETKLSASTLGGMINMIKKGTISGKIGKKLIAELLNKGGDPEEIVKKKGWIQVSSEEELLPLVKEAIDANPKAVEEYLGGKKSAIGFFVGQVMKATGGKANPGVVNKILMRELEK